MKLQGLTFNVFHTLVLSPTMYRAARVNVQYIKFKFHLHQLVGQIKMGWLNFKVNQT